MAEVFVNGSVAGSDDDGVHRAGEVPVQIPIGAQVQSSTPAGEPQAASTSSQPAAPSKLAKLLTKLKETLTGSAAKSIAVSLEASEAPKLPLLAQASTTQDAVRRLETNSIEIDLGSSETTAAPEAKLLPAVAPAKGADWKAGFVAQIAVNPNATLKVMVNSQAKSR